MPPDFLWRRSPDRRSFSVIPQSVAPPGLWFRKSGAPVGIRTARPGRIELPTNGLEITADAISADCVCVPLLPANPLFMRVREEMPPAKADAIGRGGCLNRCRIKVEDRPPRPMDAGLAGMIVAVNFYRAATKDGACEPVSFVLSAQSKRRVGHRLLTSETVERMGMLMRSEQLKVRAQEMRKIRLNQPRITRERALKLFEQHRQAARGSRLSLKLSLSGESGGA